MRLNPVCNLCPSFTGPRDNEVESRCYVRLPFRVCIGFPSLFYGALRLSPNLSVGCRHLLTSRSSINRTDAIRFALDSSSAECSEPLVVRVVERTTAVLQGGGKGRDDYSVLVRATG